MSESTLLFYVETGGLSDLEFARKVANHISSKFGIHTEIVDGEGYRDYSLKAGK